MISVHRNGCKHSNLFHLAQGFYAVNRVYPGRIIYVESHVDAKKCSNI